jgi:hypothetical protein
VDKGPARTATPTYAEASAERLRDLDPVLIERMQIVLLPPPWTSNGDTRDAYVYNLDEATRDMVSELLRKAVKRKPGMEEAPLVTARLRVFLKGGESFHVSYYDGLDAPLGPWESRTLKEALWALSHTSRVSVVRLEGEKVAGVTVLPWVPRAGDGTRSGFGPAYSVGLVLGAHGTLTLNLRLEQVKGQAITVSKEVKYGDVFTMPGRDGGLYVITLDAP